MIALAIGAPTAGFVNLVLTPPTARGHPIDATAARIVRFQLYRVGTRQLADRGGFDYRHFQHEMDKLRLPGQSFEYAVQDLLLDDEPAMAGALRSALHVGRRHGVRRRYLDSEHLHYQLTQKTAGASAHARASMVVPIFLFTSPADGPVLIDWTKQVRCR